MKIAKKITFSFTGVCASINDFFNLGAKFIWCRMAQFIAGIGKAGAGGLLSSGFINRGKTGKYLCRR
ncbi:hypothetical protein E05_43780 [Plautia stali symbiont]|nr:hypothetical protein E05_43780 [Plautia stali symbiont]